MSKQIQITVDNRVIQTDSGVMLLDILNRHGIRVPQLCNHPALAPSGACRLCMVEITKSAWNGKSKLVTSCLYPAEEGLIVTTRSPEVLQTRRALLELYLAQHPGSDVVKKLAGEEGIEETPFTVGVEDNLCVMCGLCARVCQDLGPGAISTLYRGADKMIGPNPEGMGVDCTGCRTCAYLCPTGAIPLQQKDGVLTIWNRSFEIPVCSVQPELCRGCGICEEVCPQAVPRVTLSAEGGAVCHISPTACVGCGICAGSCPTGAIIQKKTEALDDFGQLLRAGSLKNKSVVFVCPRSPMPAAAADDDELIMRVSCTGSVDIATILYCIAAGASGAALLCRDRLSCPYRQGGECGEKRVKVAGELLKLCGLEAEHLAFLEPGPGREGPAQAWREFKAAVRRCAPLLADSYRPAAATLSGIDPALDIVSWLKERPELKPQLPPALQSLFLTAAEGDICLYLKRLPELDLLLSLITHEPVVTPILEQAARLLKAKNIAVRLAAGEKELLQLNPEKVITIDTLNEPAGDLAEAAKEEPFSFRIDPQRRRRLLEEHERADSPLTCMTVERYLQYALLLRRGAWRQSLSEQPAHFLTPVPAETPAGDEGGDQAGRRVEHHPILPAPPPPELQFIYNGAKISARAGEVISSALYAAGVTVFGHHHRDGAAQGIFCANGQCSQCMVIADGKPVKACMTPVTQGMQVESVEGLPALGDDAPVAVSLPNLKEVSVEVLIIGGGPAGICAAIELGGAGVEVLLIDDKQDLGGKLSLQTHNFFGSVSDCYAGDRGVNIGHILAGELKGLPTVKTWLNSTVIGVFGDGNFGISRGGAYELVRPRRVLFATGAREKSLAFPGCDLPGVYGAGAFQTLVNRDLVRCAERLFIIGGGNVGLIGAYHALQAGIDVVGLVEALPRCGGYKVHEDKIRRLGVPVWTSHTVLRIEGTERVERVVVAAVDEKFNPIPGTERAYEVDTVLIAVGLSPVDELLQKAQEYGIKAYAAGDAEEIAEASAAIFSGKITGRRIAQDLGIDLPIPVHWEAFGRLLKHKPGEAASFIPPEKEAPVYPLIRCLQEIPCNPCTEACPQGCITMPGSILSLPRFSGECIGCGRCVLACPGLAITLLIDDYDPEKQKALLMVPFEFNDESAPLGQEVITTGLEGEVVGRGRVLACKDRETQNRRRLLLLEVPYRDKLKVAGFRMREVEEGRHLAAVVTEEEDPIICRCERVRKSEIVREIRAGVRDMNQLKAAVRAGLGGCGGKTCTDLILRIFREEGVPLSEVTPPTHRPLVAEVHLGDFIAREEEENK